MKLKKKKVKKAVVGSSSSTGSSTVAAVRVNPETKLSPDGQPKRGRGRPRKHPLPEAGVTAVKLGPDGQPKRGRGRPRKHPLPETGVAPTPVVRTITPPMPVTVEKEVANRLKTVTKGKTSGTVSVPKVKKGLVKSAAAAKHTTAKKKVTSGAKISGLKSISPKTVRALTGKTLLHLQSKKRMNSLFVVNMLPNHNVMVEVGDGSFILPDSWLPYDLSTHAEPSAYLKSPSFRSLLSPTTKRGPLLKVIDAETALAIIESPEGQAEQARLQLVERGIQPTVRQVNTNVIKKELKDLMKEVDSGRIKPRSAAAVLVNLVTNEAEKAYVLRRSTNSTITNAVRGLKLSGSRATVRGDDVTATD